MLLATSFLNLPDIYDGERTIFIVRMCVCVYNRFYYIIFYT